MSDNRPPLLVRLGNAMPHRMRDLAKRVYYAWLALIYRGRGRVCPVCSFQARRFRPNPINPDQRDFVCPRCGSLTRHRLIWLYLKDRTDLFRSTDARMLHFAAPRFMVDPLRRSLRHRYVTADLFDPSADLRVDIEAMEIEDASFDAIVCSHVLEHVDDDRRAMAEIRRVLRPGGFAIIVVPIFADHTFEDPSIIDHAERRRLFGQFDHVRAYGPDVERRIQEMGFEVEPLRAPDLVDERAAITLGLAAADDVLYICRRDA